MRARALRCSPRGTPGRVPRRAVRGPWAGRSPSASLALGRRRAPLRRRLRRRLMGARRRRPRCGRPR
eukprot:13854051-Alexandrium_andersonii.AAC.1